MPNTLTYVAVVERTPGKEFFAQFPDFPDLRVSDPTIQGTTGRSIEVLREHVAQLLHTHAGVPRPISVEAVKEDGRYRRGFLIQIDVDVPDSCLET